jgi:iron complex transport system ATP-binding protein
VSGKCAMIDYWGKPSTADRKRTVRILKNIECSYLASRPWRVLSQGERQRVLISRALMASPPLLILDEPCAGLDPVAREHFLKFLQKLGTRKNAPTVILVTHHVEEVMPAFSHAMLLKAGRILAQGSKAKVLTSELLGCAFGTRVRLKGVNGRYTMSIAPKSRAVM